jgi:catechol 2,3-dioxygenase-like lactoylglutathione lyase family enzyme
MVSSATLVTARRPGCGDQLPTKRHRLIDMLRYVYFGTNNLEAAIAFYDAALAPLGMQRCITNDPEWDRVAAGWGLYEDGGARELGFWIGKPFDQKPAAVGNGAMVAFSADSWKVVDEFYAAATANGGTCDGPPGLRFHYAPDFYAAYVRDPDGNKVAAVCRGFTGPQ